MRQFLSYIFRNPIFIVLVVCFIALLSLLFPAILPYSIPNISTGKHNLAVIIVGLVSVINCFLLYENLRSQKEQFEKNTFEKSFFRLMETHRKQVQDIFLRYYFDDGRGEIEYKGAECFEYAECQIKVISEILKTSTFESLSTDYLREYNITKEVWKKNKEKPEEIDKNAFLIFCERRQSVFEQYFRSLNLLKEYWESRATDEEKKKYKDIVFVHMSEDELGFAKRYCDYDCNYGKV